MSIINPWASECGRFEIDPIEEYEEEIILEYFSKMIKYIDKQNKKES